MQEIINKIVPKKLNLFGSNPVIEKINVGFTNTIYKVNDEFIVKICTNSDNENNFVKEIDFYKINKDNNLIPKLKYFDIDKKDIPYFYEIIEKLDGVSLYTVWHTFSEEQREDVIKQLCHAMKLMHNNKGQSYDWIGTLKNRFNLLLNQAKENNIFTEEEMKLLDKSYSYFDEYLKSTEFVLVHNDLHFDNIFINDGKIKIMDFERSMYAPRDFELDILYRMIRKPWKFATDEVEDYVDEKQYLNIMLYIEKYYPELVSVDNLYKRLAIYDMIYFLAQYVKNPEYEDLKEDVLVAANIVVSSN